MLYTYSLVCIVHQKINVALYLNILIAIDFKIFGLINAFLKAS